MRRVAALIVLLPSVVAAPAAAVPRDVKMQNTAFVPQKVQATEGDTVTWQNLDATEHNATPYNTGFPATPNVGGGMSSPPRGFSDASTTDYFCSIHGSSMEGSVLVS